MIKVLDEDLYKIVCSWWEHYKWTGVPINVLPARSYVYFDEEKPLCFGSLYKDETADFGMMDWIVANPDSTPEQRENAIREMEGHIRKVAEEIGVKLIITICVTEKLADKMEKLGYVKANKDYSAHLIKSL